MVHTAEGTLQAYLDGEIDDAAAGALSEHVAVCAECAAELEHLRGLGTRVEEALALLDSPAPVLRAHAAIAQARRGSGRRRIARVGAWSLAKAAMLFLVLAGAGAAAIPDFRRAIETTFSRVVAMLGGGQEQIAAPAEPLTPTAAEAPTTAPAESVPAEMFVTPADGRVQIVLHSPSGAVEVVVRLVEDDRAQVRTSTTSGMPRLRSAPGRLELSGLGAGTVTIGIPQDLPRATVEVDGVVRVYKESDALRSSGSDAAARGSEMRFIIDP